MRHRVLPQKLFLLLVLALLFSLTFSVSAQAGGQIGYGQSRVSVLTDENPLAVYTFQGAQGDVITAQVIPLTDGLQPAINLLSPSGQPLTTGTTDSLSKFSADALLTYALNATGRYTLLIGGATDVMGEFLLRLSASQSAAATPLTEDAPVESSLDATEQVYTVRGSPDVPLSITVSALDSASFTVAVRDEQGALVAFSGGLPMAVIVLPPGDRAYTVTITSPDGQGTVTISLGEGVPTTAGDAVPQPAATEEADLTGVPEPLTTPEVGAADDDCTVRAPGGSPINVRPQPNTNNDPIGQLTPGQALTVIGVYDNWYVVQLPSGLQGWVRRDVVNVSGPCDALPVIEPTVGDLAPATTPEVGATATHTPTAAGDIAPTATYTPTAAVDNQQAAPTATYTPTAPAPTATYTYTPPPPPPTAPADANFNSPLTIPLDSTSSVTDFVSYPNGDTQDRVYYEISGMNPTVALPGGRARLVLSVSCFGIGTEQVQFLTGGQTYFCGQTIFDQEVTYDSRTGTVTITAVGGQGTYVQWVLTGTATRVN